MLKRTAYPIARSANVNLLQMCQTIADGASRPNLLHLTPMGPQEHAGLDAGTLRLGNPNFLL